MFWVYSFYSCFYNSSFSSGSIFSYQLFPPHVFHTFVQLGATRLDVLGARRVASIVHVLCEADVLIGDQLESASPVDVSFWPMHPTLERLYHWKLLHWGGFEEVDWEPADVDVSVYGADCAGHRADDTVHLDLETLVGDSGPKVAHEAALTNAQLLDAFDPNAASLPFLYDQFDWAHCDQLGVHLGSDRAGAPTNAR